jgi:hypothetical protein
MRRRRRRHALAAALLLVLFTILGTASAAVASDPVSTSIPGDDVTDPIDDVTDTVEDVADPVEDVADPVEDVTDPVEDTVEDVADPVEDVSDPVVDTVEDVADPVEDTTDPVVDAVQDISDPLEDAVDTVTNPVTGAVDAVSAPGDGRGDGTVGFGLGSDSRSGRPRARRASGVREPGDRTADRSEADSVPRTGPEVTTLEANPVGASTKPGSDSSLLDDVATTITELAKRLAFPLALALVVLAFLAVQGQLDRKDPKLALAPVDSLQEYMSFR